MKVNKKLSYFLLLSISFFVFGGTQSGDYHVKENHGPYAKKVILSDMQNSYSSNWKHIMQSELLEPVNFAGHYRLYVDYGENLPNECDSARPLCGWIIDKITGKVVSKLPEFISTENDMSHPSVAQGCAVYSSEDDNAPPSTGAASNFPFFYRNSTLLWMNGSLLPASNPNDDKCEYQIYNLEGNKFQIIGKGDPSDDPNFLHHESE